MSKQSSFPAQLNTLPSSMFSFYILPTQKENRALVGFPRSRTIFSRQQVDHLETEFAKRKYLSTPERLQLSQKLGITPVQVKTWFQNRRMKWKKQKRQSDPNWQPTRTKGRPPNSLFKWVWRRTNLRFYNDQRTCLLRSLSVFCS